MKLKRLDPKNKETIDLFAKAIYMGHGLPFYSDRYPAFHLLPEMIKEDMRFMGKAAYKAFIKMVEAGYESK